MTLPKTADAAVWATFRGAPLAVKTILVGDLITSLGGFLNIFLVLFLTARGHDIERATLAVGVHGVGAIVGVLIGGALADRLGARRATVLGMGGTGLLITSLLFIPSYLLLLAVVLVVGLMGRISRPAAVTLLSDLTPDDGQIMLFAMSRFGLNLGAMAAPLLGFALYHLDHERFDFLFWGEGLCAVSYAVVAWFTLPVRTPRSVRAPAEVGSSGGYVAVLRDRRYALYLLAMLVHTSVYVQYLSTLPLEVTAHGLPILWYTVAVALNGFIVIAFELLLTKITQRWPFPVTIGLAFGLLGVGVACYGLPLSPAVIVIGTLIWTLGEIIGGPTIFAYPAMAGPTHLKPRYLGSFQFVYGAGAAIGPVAGGWLFVHFGHRVWLILAGGSVFATIAGLVAVKARTRPASRPLPVTVTE